MTNIEWLKGDMQVEVEDIIKAIECCDIPSDIACEECPFYKNSDCTVDLAKENIDFINKQRAEIEELRQKLIENDFMLSLVKETKAGFIACETVSCLWTQF